MKGIVFLLLLTLGAFAGVVLLIPPVMLTFVHSKRVIGWRRKYVSLISGIQSYRCNVRRLSPSTCYSKGSLLNYFKFCFSGIYFDFAAAIIRLLGGTKMYIYSSTSSEVLLSDKCALIICNHRSLVDW